jgi:thiamine-phosphate pyrophosphorylase
MAQRCLLYYITDRTSFAGDELERRRRLLEKIVEAAQAGVDYIQLREKDLSGRELESLAREAMMALSQFETDNRKGRTALLINSRTDVALAVEADGVHLRSDDVSPQDARNTWAQCGAGALVRDGSHLIGVSCHSPEDVARASRDGASFAVFGPVFEKKDVLATHPAGIAALRQACQAEIPVLALGGITLKNARDCFEAGAAGIAAIRLFQENDIAAVVKQLRG